MLQYDENIQEREDYVTDLKMGNFENDLYHAANNAGIGNLDLFYSDLYTNINDI